jgi:hypothetical protein
MSESGMGTWWATEPDMGRVADGLADDVDRVAAIGNGQVPAVVFKAWQTLSAQLRCSNDKLTDGGHKTL